MYKKSNQNIMIVLLLLGCIIMSILLIFPGLVMNRNDNINDLEENNNIEEVNVEGNYVDVIDTNYENIHPKLTSQFVKNTINLFNNDFTGDYFGYYFKEDKILVKDMDKKVLLNLALQKLANELSISKNTTDNAFEERLLALFNIDEIPLTIEGSDVYENAQYVPTRQKAKTRKK